MATGGKPSLMVIILTDSLLSRFNKLNVPLYLHPGLPLKSVQQAYFTGFSAEVNARLSMFAWGWHHEAGIHLLRLMLSGAFDKYPNLQVISGHWGEMLPFWLQRLDDSLPLAATGLSRTLTRTFQEHVYVTLVPFLSISRRPIRHLQMAPVTAGNRLNPSTANPSTRREPISRSQDIAILRKVFITYPTVPTVE